MAGYDNSDSAKTTFKVTVSEAGVYYISFRYSAGEVGGWPNLKEQIVHERNKTPPCRVEFFMLK